MNEKNSHEIAVRRKACKLFDKGTRVIHILKLIPRSRSWMYKWRQRFAEQGFAALDGLDKSPHHSPHKYPRDVVALVLHIRHRLQRSSVGLVGARAIRRELKQQHALARVPGVTSINRWLKDALAGQYSRATAGEDLLSSTAPRARRSSFMPVIGHNAISQVERKSLLFTLSICKHTPCGKQLGGTKPPTPCALTHSRCGKTWVCPISCT